MLLCFSPLAKGKTAVAEGIAHILANPETCPPPLEGHRMIEIEIASLIAGTRYLGILEERLQAILAEVKDPNSPPTILFIDEIHTMVGAGRTSGSNINVGDILKPALARGELQVIGATTIAEYRLYMEKDPALERRFQPTLVKEPTEAQTLEIVSAVSVSYAQHHGVTYMPCALVAAVQLSGRYINDRFFPDKALDLLDEAGVMV
jgi:ATP-dependent Clp protease ATP-binding subunit ClpC